MRRGRKRQEDEKKVAVYYYGIGGQGTLIFTDQHEWYRPRTVDQLPLSSIFRVFSVFRGDLPYQPATTENTEHTEREP